MGFTDLGETTDLDVIVRMIAPSGFAVIDIGCGGGELARSLVGLGCTVIGVERDPTQAVANRSAEPLVGLSFVEATAGSDGAYDGAIFSKSLHTSRSRLVGDFTRECLARVADPSLPGVRVIATLERVITRHDQPTNIISDNGTDLTGQSVLVRAAEHAIIQRYIPSAKPAQHAYIEAFSGPLRDECINEDWFASMAATRIDYSIIHQ